MQSSSEQPLVEEERYVTNLITAHLYTSLLLSKELPKRSQLKQKLHGLKKNIYSKTSAS